LGLSLDFCPRFATVDESKRDRSGDGSSVDTSEQKTRLERAFVLNAGALIGQSLLRSSDYGEDQNDQGEEASLPVSRSIVSKVDIKRALLIARDLNIPLRQLDITPAGLSIIIDRGEPEPAMTEERLKALL
jgi:hypothetical protein